MRVAECDSIIARSVSGRQRGLIPFSNDARLKVEAVLSKHRRSMEKKSISDLRVGG
jgi:hypothetical protein